jgi:hypothetical protein
MLQDRKKIRLFSFLISVVSTSTAVSFASFAGNYYLLMIALIPCIIALSVSMIPTPASIRFILVSGVSSFLVSVVVIIYAFIMHRQKILHYLGFSY